MSSPLHRHSLLSWTCCSAVKLFAWYVSGVLLFEPMLRAYQHCCLVFSWSSWASSESPFYDCVRQAVTAIIYTVDGEAESLACTTFVADETRAPLGLDAGGTGGGAAPPIAVSHSDA